MIKNIIFDFGGVLLPIEISKTALEFERLGLSDFENIYSMKKQTVF